MEFKAAVRLFLSFFYFIGISSYYPAPKSKITLFCQISKYLQAVLAAYCGISLLVVMNKNGILPQFTTAETMILNIFAACALLRSAFVLMQCHLFAHKMAEVIKIVEELETFFLHCLDHRICYKNFIKMYQRKVFFIAFFLLIHITAQTWRLLNQTASNTSTRFVLLHIMTTLNYLHSIFFIELISFHLMQLNSVIVSDVGGIPPKRSIRSRLKCYKIVHFRVWMANQRINRFFGYNWIAILFHAFSNVVYSVFWAKVSLSSGLGNFLSKYDIIVRRNNYDWFCKKKCTFVATGPLAILTHMLSAFISFFFACSSISYQVHI